MQWWDDDRAELRLLLLRCPGAQPFSDLPGDHGEHDHPGHQPSKDAHPSGANELPYEHPDEDTEHSGDNHQPAVCPDQRLGLRLERLKTTVDNLELASWSGDEPDQSDRDSG